MCSCLSQNDTTINYQCSKSSSALLLFFILSSSVKLDEVVTCIFKLYQLWSQRICFYSAKMAILNCYLCVVFWVLTSSSPSPGVSSICCTLNFLYSPPSLLSWLLQIMQSGCIKQCCKCFDVTISITTLLHTLYFKHRF